MVLGFLFSNPTYANTFKVLDIVYKDNNKIYIVKNRWGTTDRKVNIIAYNHCTSLGKKTFWTNEFRNRYKKHFKNNKGYKIKGWVNEYLCSNNVISKANNFSLTPGFDSSEVLSNGSLSYAKSNEQTNQNASTSKDINFTISEKKQQCEAIGFAPKTEKFADCVLRLVELDMKNQQSNNMIASQNKSQSDQFMSNALLNLGQQLMQPNSNIYNSNTRNCSVRKSFGNTSTVTCY